MKTINRAVIDKFIDPFHAAAMLLREQRLRPPSLQMTPMETSSRGAKEKFSVPRDAIWRPCDN